MIPHKKTFFISLFIILSIYVNGQSKTDSLFNQLHNARHDSITARIYTKIGFEYQHSKPDSAIFYFNQAKQYFKQKNKNSNDLNRVLLEIGKCYKPIQYDSAIIYFKESYKTSKITNNKEIQAEALLLQGMTIYNQSKDTSSISNINNALLIYNEIGTVYEALQEYKKAIVFYKKALHIFIKTQNKWEISNTYIRLGGAYLGGNIKVVDVDSSIFYTLKGQAGMKKLGDLYSVAGININLGNIEKGRKKYQKAIIYYKKALPFMTKNNQTYYAAMINRNIGNTYILMEQYNKAVEHYNKSVKLAKIIESNMELFSSYFKLSEAHKKLNNYKVSLKYSAIPQQ